MEPNILDLRQQRCPMALLLAKRHTVQLVLGEVLDIWLNDVSSGQDIEKYLSTHGFRCQWNTSPDYFWLKVIKELD
ncbi:sulfurtransferase TusA family protein [Vibrio anguillarum]|uniref:Sulfurtransferase TusA family protein n=1 Tax=Vibrio anguillarum TaxID=55601 RepID=A0AAW4ADI5_VIBAN|nr:MULTISPECIES: sulfurtransferase TusA family protein [Vibrio]AEH32588.1 Hypothetical transcriptional regulatory protein [Vibrio anguillarum 775]AGU57156.1 oxidoreductase [Vibrio anguillarum M3]ARV25471.1 sirA-like family protein [Vibrio anguillarum]ASF92492.1 SirA family protein [Vibrio anguillarum]ASG00410.1 SirA family protein [Vibrio anguillarum]